MSKPKRRGPVAALLLAAAVLTAVSAQQVTATAAPLPPQSDPFYQPPDDYGGKPPGTVLRSRPASLALFSLIPERGVQAWQILYRSTDALDRPMATSGLVLVPKTPPPAGRPRPLVAHNVAEDSLARKCAPSYQMQAGAPPDNLVAQAEVLLTNGLLKNGWAVVVPDHEGPDSAYGAGVLHGHAVLDSIRAAESFEPAGLAGARTPVGMLGYSGGAIATGWSAELQPSYAPELNVVGVAEGGIPADLGAAVRQMNGGLFGGYALAGSIGVGRAYPELGAYIKQILTPEGRELAGRLGESCNSMIVLQGFFKDIDKLTTVPDPLGQPIPRRVLAANKMGQHRPAAPMFMYHSTNDELVPIGPVDELVETYCAGGVTVDYNRDRLSEHILLVGTGAPLALAWLQDRMNGKPAGGCKTTTHTSMVANPVALKTLGEYLAGLGPLIFGRL